MKANIETKSQRRIGLLLLPGFQVMCFSAFSVFEVANKKAGKTIYDLHVLSEKGGPVASSFGMEVSTQPVGTREFDTILIGIGMEIPSTPPAIIAYLKESTRTTRRLASICLGSFVLGDAGLLHKRRYDTLALRPGTSTAFSGNPSGDRSNLYCRRTHLDFRRHGGWNRPGAQPG